ncbi:MAG: hypothetical protein ACMUIP_17760 [bacterium]
MIQKSLEDYNYNWKRAFRKEYGTLFLVLCGIIAMIIWKNLTLFGYQNKQFEIKTLSLLSVPLFLFYAVTRYLKKQHRLGSG